MAAINVMMTHPRLPIREEVNRDNAVGLAPCNHKASNTCILHVFQLPKCY